jgi:hypothetical protein
VEEESKDKGSTWTPSLYLLRTSTVDGNEYELRYFKKQAAATQAITDSDSAKWWPPALLFANPTCESNSS